MSRAGRRARRARLVAAGALSPETEQDHAALLHAERGQWVRKVGWTGWHAEVARRRAARIAVMRSQRLEREARSGKPPRKGRRVPSVLELLDKVARERLINRLCELEANDHLIRERSKQRPPDPPVSLIRAAAQPTERKSA